MNTEPRHAAACRAVGVLALACCVAVLGSAPSVGAQPVPGETNARNVVERLVDRLSRVVKPRCLTPAAGQALSDLVAAGGLQPVLQSDFALVRGDVGGQRIELEIQDQARRTYGITLALADGTLGQPDGQGRLFRFYLTDSPGPPNPRASAALLAAASLFDGAIPASALGPCGGEEDDHADRRYPLAFALVGAVVEATIVLVAVWFGLRALRPPGAVPDGEA